MPAAVKVRASSILSVFQRVLSFREKYRMATSAPACFASPSAKAELVLSKASNDMTAPQTFSVGGKE